MCRMTDELIIVLLRRDFCARCVTWESYFSTVLVVGTRFGIVVDGIIGTLLRLLLITLFSPHVMLMYCCTVYVRETSASEHMQQRVGKL